MDRELLVHLANTIPAKVIVEVGCYVGMTTVSLMKGTEADVHCVDHFAGNPSDRLKDIHPRITFETFCRNLRPWLFQRVQLHVGKSSAYAAAWPRDLEIDMVFIDANHDYLPVMEDILSWRSLLMPGKILAGHDFECTSGVPRAVRELFKDDFEHKGEVWWVKT